MSLDDVVCRNIKCIFNDQGYKLDGFGIFRTKIIKTDPICNQRGKPNLNKKGICIEFVKIKNKDNFKPLYFWFKSKKYTDSKHNQILKNYIQCKRCGRYGKKDEAVIDLLEYCPTCYDKRFK